MLAAFFSSRFSFHSLPLIKPVRRLVPVGVQLTIRQVTDHIDRLDLKSSGFLAAVKAGDKAALQQKQAGLFADMTDTVHLVFGYVFGGLLQTVVRDRNNNSLFSCDTPLLFSPTAEENVSLILLLKGSFWG